eukprot:TRINITY_DN7269_c0_g1_i1.p1 TRINITY_DN7269_c0_g1~~TRINITY_DN7269_c0_g1_i1.p1  ORF type:complete len:114 (-),score=24.57 TRINITY_DN7269_c0_g1_i1:131-472(-)
MGNSITGAMEGVGTKLLARSTASGVSERFAARYALFGNELVANRATYVEAKEAISVFKATYKEGAMTGRDIAGIAACGASAFAGLQVGIFTGRFGGPYELPHSKYDDHHGDHH